MGNTRDPTYIGPSRIHVHPIWRIHRTPYHPEGYSILTDLCRSFSKWGAPKNPKAYVRRDDDDDDDDDTMWKLLTVRDSIGTTFRDPDQTP